MSFAGPFPRIPSSLGRGCQSARGVRLVGLCSIRTIVVRTVSGCFRFRGPKDHPHSGGENLCSLLAVVAPVGPSPRGWGEHRRRIRDIHPIRTIPTRVGRTRIAVKKPRDSRTTPTRVGRTTRRPATWKTRADHPHAGGENKRKSAVAIKSPGPSPRGWGEHWATHSPPPNLRTIPTRVGRTEPRRDRGTF